MNLAFKPIEKEDIEGLNFPAEEVLADSQEIAHRKQELENAMALGNTEDDKDLWVTNTTVWAVTPVHIVLKKGVTIPINRIYRIM